MAKRPTTHTLPEGLQELLELEQAEWPARLAVLRASGELLAAGEDDEDKDEEEDKGKGEEEEDEQWDETRARETIQKQRRSEQAAIKAQRAAEKRLKELEDERKSDEEKREEARAAAERERDEARGEALRLRVAIRKGLTDVQARRLVGTTEEELEQDADELLSSFKPEAEREEESRERGSSSRRPAERLRPGAAPGAEPEEDDPRKLAEQVPRV